MTNPNHLHLDSPEHEQNRKDYQRLHRRDLNDRLTNPSRGQRRDISYNAKDFRLQLDFIRRLFYTITGSGNRTVYKMRQEEDNKDPILIKKDSIYDTVLNYFDDEIEPLFFDADGDLLMYVTNCVAEIYAPHTTERTVQNASKSRFANTYIPPTYKPKKQVSQRPIIWQQYLKRFMPDTELCWYEGNEQNKFPQQKYFEQWIAHRVQKPHEAPEVALILRGDQGTGKSFTFDNILREIVGVTNYEALNLKTIKGPFNAGVFKNVCIQIEEANTTEDKYASDRNKTAEN